MLATLAQSLLLLALGMMIGVPTLVIAALLHSPTGLSMSSNQASWFGKSVLPYDKLVRIIFFIPSVSFSMKPASGVKLFFITVQRAYTYTKANPLMFICMVLFIVKTQNMVIKFLFMYFYSYVFSHFHI